MRVHILLGLLFVGVVPIIFFTLDLIRSYTNNANDNRIAELQRQGSTVVNLITSTGYLSDPTIAEVNSELTLLAGIYEGRILVVNENLTIIKDTYGLEEGKTIISEEAIKGIKGTDTINEYKNRHYVELTIPIIQNSSKKVLGILVVISSNKSIYAMSDLLTQKASILLITTIILVLVFAFFYSGALIKPLVTLKNVVGHLTEGYMDEEVTIDSYHEIKQISDSLNQMLLRIKNLESSRQEFVSNVSHELKTPLTSVKVLADSLLMQDNVQPELYREFLVDIADEIERENKIINDLLSLVKLDKTASDMNISSVKINDLLEQVLKRLRPIAKKRNIELVFESFRPVVAEVDEVKLSLAISNLIENAIKYNVEDGWVRVSLNADHKYFYVKVADSGIGIPEDAQDFIFERFYRVDKARSRGTGGTGLGLSIAKNAIHMHKGAIKVYSKENEGTTFTVRIPINYIV